jgi:hypothetical protein
MKMKSLIIGGAVIRCGDTHLSGQVCSGGARSRSPGAQTPLKPGDQTPAAQETKAEEAPTIEISLKNSSSSA